MSIIDQGKKPDIAKPSKTASPSPDAHRRNAEYKTVGELIRKQFSIGK